MDASALTREDMDDSRFRQAFAEIVEPVLRARAFQRFAKPRGWMAPAELFEANERWFGASWDWRDQYLEVDLGHLFEFRDVMPRVIILGPLRRGIDCSQHPEGFVSEQLAAVALQVPALLESFDDTVEAAIRAHLAPREGANKKARRTVAEFAVRVGKRMMRSEWNGIPGVAPE